MRSHYSKRRGLQSSARKETDVGCPQPPKLSFSEILNGLGSLAVKALGELPLLKIAGLLDDSLAAGSQVKACSREGTRLQPVISRTTAHSQA